MIYIYTGGKSARSLPFFSEFGAKFAVGQSKLEENAVRSPGLTIKAGSFKNLFVFPVVFMRYYCERITTVFIV